MDQQRFLDLAFQIMPLPTAPYHEHFVIAAVQDFVTTRPGIRLSMDPCGNLLLRYDGRKRKTRRQGYLIATAHLDHPGLGFAEHLSATDFLFEQLGGVDPRLAYQAGVLIYHLGVPCVQPPVRGQITAFLQEESGAPPAFTVKVQEGDPQTIGPGSFAMWDLEALEKRDCRLWGRACDDLAGVTAGLAFLDELNRQQLPVRAGLLLTRAEETGFGGMLAAVRAGYLDSAATYLNLECSSIRAGAVLGEGPVIRVGDRWWIFDPAICGGLARLARQLASADTGFRFQRKLMDAGTCEATVLTSAGYRTGALALPLKNYHNTGKKRLRPEGIHLNDALGLVDLLVCLACQPEGMHHTFQTAIREVDKLLTRRYVKSVSRLRKSLEWPRR